MARVKTIPRHKSQLGHPATKGKGKAKGKAAKRAIISAPGSPPGVSGFKGYKSNVGGVKRPRPARPGTVALREIRKWQNATDLILPFRPFLRVVKDIALDIAPFKFQSTAVKALQECAEAFLVELFEDAQAEAIHAGRVTIMVRDIEIVLRIRRDRFSPHRYAK